MRKTSCVRDQQGLTQLFKTLREFLRAVVDRKVKQR